MVVLSEIVGFGIWLQHTPLEVTDNPPVEVTLPPLVPVVGVMDEIVEVVITGIEG
jgi:hypothetical protein